jgi:hypothetical protein
MMDVWRMVGAYAILFIIFEPLARGHYSVVWHEKLHMAILLHLTVKLACGPDHHLVVTSFSSNVQLLEPPPCRSNSLWERS